MLQWRRSKRPEVVERHKNTHTCVGGDDEGL